MSLDAINEQTKANHNYAARVNIVSKKSDAFGHNIKRKATPSQNDVSVGKPDTRSSI